MRPDLRIGRAGLAGTGPRTSPPRWRRALPAALLLLLPTGCATRGSVQRLQTDLAELRGDLAALHTRLDETARDGARALAEARALEARLRELSATVREAGQEIARLRGQVEAAEEAVKALRGELQARFTPAPPAPPPAAETPAREAAPRTAAAAEAAYQAALATFRAREHGQAILEFLDFLAKYPKHPLAASAQYWIGEAYFLQRDYRQALAEFQKVLDQSADDDRTADALLRIGLCYARLHEPGRAEQAWQRLVRDFPDSEAAERARSLLRRRASSR